MGTHRILVTVGTRPEAIKLAPVIRALHAQDGIEVRVLATGQHRDLVAPILDFFDVRVDLDLALMQPEQSPAQWTGRALAALDSTLAEGAPDLVIGQGDTGTVLATALACFYRSTPFAHIEAGLRSGSLDAPFPEEMHRVVAARLATLHFAPTPSAADHLHREGVDPSRVEVTGNTVVDAVHWAASRLPPPPSHTPAPPLVLVTAHRREHFGPPLDEICAAVLDLARETNARFLFPVHPNPAVRDHVHEILEGVENIELCAPLNYAACIQAVRDARFVLTDSGGLQEECPALGTPVLVMRETTEREEGITAGGARLVGIQRTAIREAGLELLREDATWERMRDAENPYGDGNAAERIVAGALRFLSGATPEA